MSRTSYTLAELARRTGCQVEGDENHSISGVSDLVSATSTDAAFLSDKRYLKAIDLTKAGVIILHPTTPRPNSHNYLLADKPLESFQRLIEILQISPTRPSGFTGIHPTAVIHPSVVLGRNLTIGPHVVIDQQTQIGDHTRIGASSFIGTEVQIGQHCLIHPNVTIIDGSQIGNRVILQPGVVVGSPGFGYQINAQGEHIRLPHIGNVVIEDDVEVGANTAIDQAKYGSTRIGKGTKIDNLVQIAHNVQIGKNNIIIGQTGIAGSSSTGKWVVLAGQVGVSDHVTIGDQVTIAARSGVSKSLPKPGVYSGVPAIPIVEYNTNAVYIRQLDKLVKRVEALERSAEEEGP